MNSPNVGHAQTRFSIRTLLSLAAISALVFVAWNQHHQNARLMRRLDMLSSRMEHLDASNEEMRAKLEFMVESIRDEPVLGVPLSTD